MANLKLFARFFSIAFILFFRPSLGWPTRHCIRRVYSLGDSIADTGNLVREGAPGPFSTIAHLPYGETTFKKPTGRCSDGLLMIDYVAMFLGLPLVTPYLEKDGNFEHGVNFAVAGATALDHSFFEERGIMMPYTKSSLNVQLEWLKAHLNSTCSSPLDYAEKLKEALVLVGEIGGNDYNYAFLSGKTTEELMSYVPHVVDSIINAAKEVITLGADRVVVPGNFPIGCMPVYLTLFHSKNRDDYDKNGCLKVLNSFAVFHNTKLQEALKDLRKSYRRVLIKYADYYSAFVHLINYASFFGFDESSLLKACCGSGGDHNFDITKPCGVRRAAHAYKLGWDSLDTGGIQDHGNKLDYSVYVPPLRSSGSLDVLTTWMNVFVQLCDATSLSSRIFLSSFAIFVGVSCLI